MSLLDGCAIDQSLESDLKSISLEDTWFPSTSPGLILDGNLNVGVRGLTGLQEDPLELDYPLVRKRPPQARKGGPALSQ